MKAKDKLKDYIHSTIVTSGYDLSYIDFGEGHLNKLIQLCEDVKEELRTEHCAEELKNVLSELGCIINSNRLDDLDKWNICKKVNEDNFNMINFNWKDKHTTYETDITAFYKAAEEYIRSL